MRGVVATTQRPTRRKQMQPSRQYGRPLGSDSGLIHTAVFRLRCRSPCTAVPDGEPAAAATLGRAAAAPWTIASGWCGYIQPGNAAHSLRTVLGATRIARGLPAGPAFHVEGAHRGAQQLPPHRGLHSSATGSPGACPPARYTASPPPEAAMADGPPLLDRDTLFRR